MDMFFVALLTISLDRLPAESVPAASGLNNFLRITSGSFATSLTTTFWGRREALHQSRLVESLSVYDPVYSSTLNQLHGRGFLGDSAVAMLMHQVIGQGYLRERQSGWLAAGAGGTDPPTGATEALRRGVALCDNALAGLKGGPTRTSSTPWIGRGHGCARVRRQ